MAKRHRRRVGPSRGYSTDLPGEYRLVEVVPVSRELLRRDTADTQLDNFVLRTSKLDDKWTLVVGLRDQEMELPHKVVRRILAHIKRIDKAIERDKAYEKKQARLKAMVDEI